MSFIATLFIIAQNQNEPKCPSTDELISDGISIKWNATLVKMNYQYMEQRG